MKPLREAWDTFGNHTSRASAVARQLAFAGIAVVWIFKIESSVIPDGLRVPLMLFILALAFDLLQYIYLSTAWWFVTWNAERKLTSDDDILKNPPIHVPKYLNHPGNALWTLKVAAVMFGYVVLLRNLYPILFVGLVV